MNARQLVEDEFNFAQQSRERQLGQALQNASEQGLDIVVKMLLDAGADVHYNHDYSIFAAAFHGHGRDNIKVIKMLVKAGADITDLTAEQLRELGLSRGDYRIAAHHQLRKKPTTEARVLGGPTTRTLQQQLDVALKDACKANSIDVVKLLLKNGASPNSKKWDPLSWAIESNNWEMINLLIDAGADLNVKRGRGYRMGPLKTAVRILRWRERPESRAIVKLLLDKGADMSDLNEEDMRVLSTVASKSHYVGSARRLLSKEVTEGWFKNAAAAGIIGASALAGTGHAAPAADKPQQAQSPTKQSDHEQVPEPPQKSETAPVQNQNYNESDDTYTFPVSTWTQSMGEHGWCGHVVIIQRVGDGPGQIPWKVFEAFCKKQLAAGKPGPVVVRTNPYSGEVAGHWGQGTYTDIMHRVKRIQHWPFGILTQGDNNHYSGYSYGDHNQYHVTTSTGIDPGLLTADDIKGVCVGVMDPLPGMKYQLPTPKNPDYVEYVPVSKDNPLPTNMPKWY